MVVAQSDYNIDSSVTPAQLRAELNLILASIVSNNSGPSEPSPAFALMLWADTLNGLIKIRNTANTAWVVVGKLDKVGLDLDVLRRISYQLGTPLSGNDVSTPQLLLGVSAPLEANTVYEFELMARLQKTAGTTNHALQLLFGGSATLSSLAYHVNVDAAVGTVGSGNGWITTSASTSILTSIASATANVTVRARGRLRVSAAGTFVPQYQLTAAPGGAYAVQADSFISLLPLGTGESPTQALNLGGWT
jgi:hypothetical protein